MCHQIQTLDDHCLLISARFHAILDSYSYKCSGKLNEYYLTYP